MDSVTYDSVRPRTARATAHYWLPRHDRDTIDAFHRHARRSAAWSGTVQRLHYHDRSAGCDDEVHEDIAA